MLIEVDNAKGFRDVLPPESLKIRMIREIIEKHFRLHGFLPMETPIIEYDELMRSDSLDGEDEAISSRFRLKDRGGRNLGLRFELTFSLARVFKQNPNIKLPFRRYQIGPSFRDEPTGPMRFRQFTQCDADIIGDSSLQAEVELLSMTSDILNELEIDAEIVINHRKLIKTLIESVHLQEYVKVMRELDKIDKLGEDYVKSSLRRYGDANQILTLFKLLEKDLIFFKQNAFEGADELLKLVKECKRRHIGVSVMPSLVRGLNYYTDMIFEVRLRGQHESIASGGRYDNTVGKYLKNKIPAVGISFGLERMSLATEKNPGPAVKALLLSIHRREETLLLEQRLREAGIPCISMEDSPTKALEYSNHYSIPYVIFIGDEEIAKKKIKLKNMQSGEEQLLNEKQLIKMLRK